MRHKTDQLLHKGILITKKVISQQHKSQICIRVREIKGSLIKVQNLVI